MPWTPDMIGRESGPFDHRLLPADADLTRARRGEGLSLGSIALWRTRRRRSGPAPAGPRSPVARGETSEGTEPDPRFTFANERTFLAWNRTALALVVAGLAITQLLPPFPGIPWGRHVIGVPLIALGAVVSTASYLEWKRDQRALRLGRPLPRTLLPRILTVVVAAECVLAAAIVTLSAGAGR